MNSTYKSVSMLVLAGVMLGAANVNAMGEVKNVNVKVTNLPDVFPPTAPSQLVDLIKNSPCPNPIFADQNSVALDDQVRPDGVRGTFEVPPGKTLVLTEVSLSLGVGPSRANHPVIITLVRASPSTGNPIDVENIVLDNSGNGTARFSFPTGTHFPDGTTACLRTQDATTADFIGIVNAFAHGFLIDDF